MKIEDEVLEILSHLPDDKKADVLRYAASVDASFGNEARPTVSPDRAAASMQWISEHRAEYAGKWVALDGDRLVASGDDGKEVVATVRRLGISGPFITRIEAVDEQAICGEWL
jgi:hypothetical protein